MTSRNKYINPLTKRAKEMRDREKLLHKNKPVTDDIVFNSLIVANEQISNAVPVGYYDNTSNSKTIPIAENYNKDSNLIDNAIAFDKSNKPLLSYLFTPKATLIKEKKEIVALPPIYKSNFNAGKSKKKSKNKKVKKTRKTIKLKKRH